MLGAQPAEVSGGLMGQLLAANCMQADTQVASAMRVFCNIKRCGDHRTQMQHAPAPPDMLLAVCLGQLCVSSLTTHRQAIIRH